jgi:hypothetical protein
MSPVAKTAPGFSEAIWSHTVSVAVLQESLMLFGSPGSQPSPRRNTRTSATSMCGTPEVDRYLARGVPSPASTLASSGVRVDAAGPDAVSGGSTTAIALPG